MKTSFTLIAFLIHLSLTSPAQAALRAGAYVADATPKELPVLVNGGMTSRSIKEVGSRITARAIVLDDGKTQLAMVVVDSCMLPRAFLEEVKVSVNTELINKSGVQAASNWDQKACLAAPTRSAIAPAYNIRKSPGNNRAICANPTFSAGSLRTSVTNQAKTTDCIPHARYQLPLANR